MDVTIRKATESDAATLARIGGALFEQTYCGMVSPDEMATRLEQDFGVVQQLGELRDPAVASFLVEADAETLGFAQLRERALSTDSGASAEVELWRIYLDRSLHGRGAAQRLLSVVGEEARSRGATGMWLAVWEKNARAISFYEKHGFQRVGRQDFHVGAEVHCDLVFRGSANAF